MTLDIICTRMTFKSLTLKKERIKEKCMFRVKVWDLPVHWKVWSCPKITQGAPMAAWTYLSYHHIIILNGTILPQIWFHQLAISLSVFFLFYQSLVPVPFLKSTFNLQCRFPPLSIIHALKLKIENYEINLSEKLFILKNILRG